MSIASKNIVMEKDTINLKTSNELNFVENNNFYEDVIINGEKYTKTQETIDNGKKNLGFDISETSMEFIDNALDSGATKIDIKVLEKPYIKLTEIDNIEPITSIRFSIIYSDNGCGFADLNKIYNLHKDNKDNSQVIKLKCNNINEFFNKNSKYDYGLYSSLNIASEIKVFTKRHDSSWEHISFVVDNSTGREYRSNVREINLDEIQMLKRDGHDLSRVSGSIIYINGIEKIFTLGFTVDEIVNNLLSTLAITYSNILANDKQILINSIPVIGTNPLGLDLSDSYIAPRIFGEYFITLRQIIDELDDPNFVNDYFLSPYGDLFENSDLNIYDQYIKVTLTAINKNIKISGNGSSQIKSKYSNLQAIYFPKYEFSGFYLLRNNRYIGTALGMMGIVKNHPDHTKFRGEISFTPLFDKLFSIQPNKNKNELTPAIISVIRNTILNDSSLIGDSVASKIKNSINGNSTLRSENLGTSFDNQVNTLHTKCLKLKKSLMNYGQDCNNIDDVLSKVENITTTDDLSKLQCIFAKLNVDYKENYKNKYKYVVDLIRRYKNNKSRKFLTNVDEKFEYLVDLLSSPLQEIELSKRFEIVFLNFPEEFDFFPIDHNTHENIDMLVNLFTKTWDELNMENRYGILLDLVEDDLTSFLNENNFTYDNVGNPSFIEFKMKLEPSINHSLVFVSHIICWDKSKVNEVNTVDGLYGFTDDTKTLLVSSDGSVDKMVKVIYLKNLIENLTRGKYKRIY